MQRPSRADVSDVSRSPNGGHMNTPTPIPAPLSEEDHPESHCQKCGGPNIVWFAASDLWNRVVGEEEECSILCPICFVEMAEAKGIKPPAWQVVKEATESETAALDAEAERLANMYHKGVEARVELERKLKDAEATLTAKDEIIAGLTRERDGEREAREKCSSALRQKDEAMGELFRRLHAARVDCSDLIS